MSGIEILNPAGGESVDSPNPLAEKLLDRARELADAESLRRLETVTGQLRHVHPDLIEGDDARIAFWVDVYNALVLHLLHLRPVRGSILRQLRSFGRVGYEIGGRPYPPNVIEHGIVRRNRRAPFSPRKPLRATDPRLEAMPSRLDPRIHFALNCGARSCPPIRHYEPSQLDAQLELATRSYLEQGLRVEGDRVTLPRLLRLYRADFGSRGEQLEFVAERRPEIASQLRDGEPRVRYARFDWSAV